MNNKKSNWSHPCKYTERWQVKYYLNQGIRLIQAAGSIKSETIGNIRSVCLRNERFKSKENIKPSFFMNHLFRVQMYHNDFKSINCNMERRFERVYQSLFRALST